MRSIPTALVLVLAAAALIAPAAPAAAAPTCDGKTATIVGKQDALVGGTEDADVIVSNGARWVYGRGGDDRICMTGSPSAARMVVFADAGDDRVFIRTAVRRHVTANLGDGSDLYIGGPGKDDVHAGEPRTSTNAGGGPKDADLDRIATGPGADHVTVGQVDLLTRDVVRLGRHSDRLTVIGLAAAGHVFAGNDGRDTLRQTWELAYEAIPDQPLELDNTNEVATIEDQVVLRWESFQNFEVDYHPAGVHFRGSSRPESIDSFNLEGASMGGNDDMMRLTNTRPILNVLSGGRGRDRITSYGSTEGYATGDLTTGRIDHASMPDERPEVRFAGIEDLQILGDAVRLVGNDGPNQLDGYGCSVTIVGGGGNDTLLSTRHRSYDFGTSTYCGRLSMLGGDGDDRLAGGAGADELYGGRGTDTADGQAGSDLCRAETRRNCERD